MGELQIIKLNFLRNGVSMYKQLMVCMVLTVALALSANAIESSPIVHKTIDGTPALNPVPLDHDGNIIFYDMLPGS